jgi:N-methylhydantoinase A
MDVLGMRRVVVPLDPGNLSAFGLLTVDVRNDYVRTAVMRHSRLDLDRVRQLHAELTAAAAEALAREGFGERDQVFESSADLRYFGQGYEVRIPWGVAGPRADGAGGQLSAEGAEQVVTAFHDEHRRLYGYDFRDDPRQEVEWVNLRVTGIGPIRKPALRRAAEGAGASAAKSGVRPVHFDRWTEATVYDRRRLGHGDVVVGPAVVEEFSSTVPVHPGFSAAVDQFGNIVITGGAA